MQILKAELKSWMLGEFAPLKSKHDSGVAGAKQLTSLDVIANKVKQSFLHCHCEPKARQFFLLHNNGLPRRYAPRNDLGRSMIEMLGVLAIVGILSVGGIAGYSKAMQKFKVNKIIYEYNNVIFGMLEKADKFRYLEHQHLGAVLKSMDVIPKSWKMLDSQTIKDDIVGNEIMIYNNHGSEQYMLTLELRLGGAVYKKNSETNYMCREVLSNLVYPLHDTLYNFFIWQADMVTKVWYGDKYVSPKRMAIKNMTPADIQSACSLCVDKGQGLCAIVISF